MVCNGVGLGRMITLAMVVLASGCASRPHRGECKDYKPLPICSPGFRVECEVGEDGCERCGCVPIVDDQGRSPYEPR